MAGRGRRLQAAEGRRAGQRLGAAHGHLHHQVIAQHAVLDAGTAALITQRQRRSAGQVKALSELLQQQHSAIADDMSPRSNAGPTPSLPTRPVFDSLFSTLWR